MTGPDPKSDLHRHPQTGHEALLGLVKHLAMVECAETHRHAGHAGIIATDER